MIMPMSLARHAVRQLTLLGLADILGLERFGIVSHDVGSFVAQRFAARHPRRVRGLFFFNCVYPGIGRRWLEPDSVTEIWYQSFHQMEMAPALVGATRESCRAYIGHFLRHWAHRKDAHDDVLEVYIDNFLKPGNLEGGFAHYKASHAGRIAVMKGETPTPPPITTPTCVRWAELDPLFPYSWTDQLKESFADLDLAPFPGVGHFPHRENPDRAAREIDEFFSRHGWR
jgi:pimeloyl-ACP methyl ester carboxylesterase